MWLTWRLALTAAGWAWASAHVVYDGRPFTNAMWMALGIGAGSLPWLPLLRRRAAPRRRRLAVAILSASALALASIGLSLPGAYEVQRTFERRMAE